MKRTKVLVLLVIFFCGGLIFNSQFVKASNTNEATMIGATDDTYIQYLINLGVIDGTLPFELLENNNITRAEAATIILKTIEPDEGSHKEQSFYDVSEEHWAYEHIESAAMNNIINGYPDNSFKPDNPITRAEASKILLELTEEPISDIEWPESVADVDDDHWGSDEITAFYNLGIFSTDSEAYFNPDEEVRLNEFAKALSVLITIIPENTNVELLGVLEPIEGDVYLKKGEGKFEKITEETVVAEGMKIRTGFDSRGEIKTPDGSGILLEQNAEMSINTARGLPTIMGDGRPGIMVHTLQLELMRGTIHGSLAPAIPYDHYSTNDLTGDKIGEENVEEQWWKGYTDRPSRIEIDMPWGVAGVRGTVWMNEVEEDYQRTNVLYGSVEVLAADTRVIVDEGQSTSIVSSGEPPSQPETMSEQEIERWDNNIEWVREREEDIQLKRPIFTPLDLNTSPDQNGTPLGQDESRIPPGQNGTPPGQDDNFVPPGQNGTPPGQDRDDSNGDDRNREENNGEESNGSETGESESATREEESGDSSGDNDINNDSPVNDDSSSEENNGDSSGDSEGTPPGQDESRIPPGQNGTPPGQDDNFVPPGQNGTPPGQNRNGSNFTPPGRR